MALAEHETRVVYRLTVEQASELAGKGEPLPAPVVIHRSALDSHLASGFVECDEEGKPLPPAAPTGSKAGPSGSTGGN